MPRQGAKGVRFRQLGRSSWRDELKDFGDEFRGDDEDSLSLLGQAGFDFRRLVLFGLAIVVLGQFANVFFGPATRQTLFLHRFFLRTARRNALKALPRSSYVVT